MDALQQGFDQAWSTIAAYTPKVIAAIVILLLGWIIARIIRNVIRRLLGRLPLEDWMGRIGLGEATARVEPVGILAGILYWLILFITFQLTAQALGATALVDALEGVIAFIPQLLIAIAILAVVAAIASFVADTVRSTAGDPEARIARWSLLIFGLFAALNQIGLSPEIVNALFYGLLITVGGAAVIAFGVGGIPVARDVTRDWVDELRGSGPSTSADAGTGSDAGGPSAG